MKCPCEECLCVPICRNKVYVKLVQCSLLETYLIDPLNFTKRPPQRVAKIEKILDPIIWSYVNNENGSFITLKRVD